MLNQYMQVSLYIIISSNPNSTLDLQRGANQHQAHYGSVLTEESTDIQPWRVETPQDLSHTHDTLKLKSNCEHISHVLSHEVN